VEDTLDLADRRDDGPANPYQVNPYDVDRYGQTPADPWPGGISRSGLRRPEVQAPGVYRPVADAAPPRSRVSFWATAGLILSLVALCATLTGLLALEGLALALLGLLASIFGLVGTSRPGITGRTLALLGLLAALGAAWLAVAALTGNLSWLDSHTDAVPRWRGWLVSHWRWLGRW
jgi:hypothetical protein